MYYIIETKQQLEQFVLYNYKEAFIEVIPNSYNIHPAQDKISLIYIRPVDLNKGFFICVEHSETLNISQNLAEKALKTYNKLYTINKKDTLHYLPLKSLWDINVSPIKYEIPLTDTHKLFYKQYSEYDKINQIIPISKHYEMCEKIFEDFKDTIKEEYTPYEQIFNNKTSIIFNGIERNGIKIDKNIFEEHFYPTENNIVHTQYNIKTITSRPSNHYNNINFAALNKKNGCRKSFIAKNSYLLEMDISAMHPTLIGGLIKHDFGTTDIHQYFADLYGTSYDEAKTITFRQMYGGIYKQYKHLEFFQKLDLYIQDLWNKFNQNGYIIVPISKYIIKKEYIDDPTPQKLFNFYIQAVETAINVIIIWDILKYLRNYNTQLIHTVYDSFLFDVDEKEPEIIPYIRNIFIKYGLTIKEKTNNNYDFSTH